MNCCCWQQQIRERTLVHRWHNVISSIQCSLKCIYSVHFVQPETTDVLFLLNRYHRNIHFNRCRWHVQTYIHPKCFEHVTAFSPPNSSFRCNPKHIPPDADDISNRICSASNPAEKSSMFERNTKKHDSNTTSHWSRRTGLTSVPKKSFIFVEIIFIWENEWIESFILGECK